MLMNDDVMIPTYTEVNRVCLKDRHTQFLRVWYAARHLDLWGKGWLYVDEFTDCITALDLSEKRASQLIKGGMGMFWWQSGNVIRLVGLDKLGLSLGLDSGEGHRVYMPYRAFMNLTLFNAHCYATWFAHDTQKHVYVDANGKVSPDGGKVLSRRSLTVLFGITRYTQQTYEELAEMSVEPQVAVFKTNQGDVENIPFTENFLNGERGGVWYFDVDGDGQHEVVKQMPNRYASANLPVESHRRRVRTDGSLINREAEPAQFNRAYYQKTDAAAKAFAHNKTDNGIAYIITHKHLELRRGVYYRAWRTIY